MNETAVNLHGAHRRSLRNGINLCWNKEVEQIERDSLIVDHHTEDISVISARRRTRPLPRGLSWALVELVSAAPLSFSPVTCSLLVTNSSYYSAEPSHTVPFSAHLLRVSGIFLLSEKKKEKSHLFYVRKFYLYWCFFLITNYAWSIVRYAL